MVALRALGLRVTTLFCQQKYHRYFNATNKRNLQEFNLIDFTDEVFLVAGMLPFLRKFWPRIGVRERVIVQAEVHFRGSSRRMIKNSLGEARKFLASKGLETRR